MPRHPNTQHHRTLWVVSLTLLLCSCGKRSTNTPSKDANTITSIDSAVIDATAGQWQEVFASFGTIETIAGTGQIKDKGVNGWLASYEGGPAIAAELSRPHMAQGGADGKIYIADKDAHAIRLVDSSGTITTVAGTNIAGNDGDDLGVATAMRLSSPNGLWVSGTGAVYIFDLGNDRVLKLRDGNMSTLFKIGGAGVGRGLWVADDETLAYVATGASLKKWTPEAGVTTMASGFVSLGNLVVAKDGSILVADRGGHRVYRVSADGDKTVVAGNGQSSGGGDGQAATSTALNEVRGVWLEPTGGFFVATHRGDEVWYVDPIGTIHQFLHGEAGYSHAGDGLPFQDSRVRISEPRAITMDARGNLLITEHDGGFIRRVNRL